MTGPPRRDVTNRDTAPGAVDCRSVTDALREPILAVDATGEIVYANERSADVFDTPRGDLVGSGLETIGEFVDGDPEPLLGAVRAVTGGDAAERRVELVTVHPPSAPVDRRLTVEARVVPFEDGGRRGATVVLRDVSERGATAESADHRRPLFEAVFESHSAPMLLIEPDSGAIEYANRAAVEFYGHGPGELCSLRIQDINTLSPEAVARERARADRQDRNHFEFEHELASGETRAVEVHSAPIDVDDRQFLFSIVHDISERRTYEHELRLFREAVERAGHSVIVTDADGIIEYVNPAFEASTGYDREAVVGRTPQLLAAGDETRQTYRELWEADPELSSDPGPDDAAPGPDDAREAETVNQRKSGELYYAELTVAPITDGDSVTNFVAVQSDITDRKLREKRLSELHRILRHNLRNGLSAIIGHGEVLAGDLTGAQRSQLAAILDRAEELAALSGKINSMQQYLTGDQHAGASCDIAAELRRVVARIEEEFPHAVVETDAEPAVVPLDATLCRTLLWELLDNAVRHNDRAHPRVTVTVDTPGADEKQVRCSVADDGPAIPATERSAVELGREGQLRHGTGIGLSRVHWIVTDHGGEVSIRDRSPRGNLVELSLPRGETPRS
jgi:PAS domain S-box-containing protein